MTQMEERYLYLLVWNKCLALSTQKVWETVSIYEYRDKKLLESIEISNSSSSLVWAKSNYWIDKKKGRNGQFARILRERLLVFFFQRPPFFAIN